MDSAYSRASAIVKHHALAVFKMIECPASLRLNLGQFFFNLELAAFDLPNKLIIGMRASHFVSQLCFQPGVLFLKRGDVC